MVFRCYLDRFQQTNIVEWNKKRKLQTEQLDLPRQKHKCWARRFSCENGSTSDDISEPKSSRGSNSFGEDSDTAISVNEEGKLQIDCAKPYLHGRPSHGPLEVDRVSEREPFCDALMNLEEQSLALGICSDHVYSEYVRDGNMHSIEKEVEDVFSTHGAIPNMYILSSGKWNVNQGMLSSGMCSVQKLLGKPVLLSTLWYFIFHPSEIISF
ncbi:protein FAR-RED ELONGATED HYPOCOTYL 1 isoform X2 [Neltuma alba]|uniref:protein FAR-RED ELONGATED HYPOCOTYL 1 isoform X2 n=1 Tax=Neltuma alba TaxID=207710 RepID=UPI0010A3ABFF|nr:protein FAR-RED ELONGATED HYPOCOTYL 1-like isoform X2 [Prosopis alba]